MIVGSFNVCMLSKLLCFKEILFFLIIFVKVSHGQLSVSKDVCFPFWCCCPIYRFNYGVVAQIPVSEKF